MHMRSTQVTVFSFVPLCLLLAAALTACGGSDTAQAQAPCATAAGNWSLSSPDNESFDLAPALTLKPTDLGFYLCDVGGNCSAPALGLEDPSAGTCTLTSLHGHGSSQVWTDVLVIKGDALTGTETYDENIQGQPPVHLTRRIVGVRAR
jgi:hypothetical protein